MTKRDMQQLKRAGLIANYRILLEDDDGEIIEMSVQPILARHIPVRIPPRLAANMREIVHHTFSV